MIALIVEKVRAKMVMMAPVGTGQPMTPEPVLTSAQMANIRAVVVGIASVSTRWRFQVFRANPYDASNTQTHRAPTAAQRAALVNALAKTFPT